MNAPNLFDQHEFARWMAQAEDTLASAHHDLKDGDYNWACFKAQQSGEYSVKALTYGLGEIAVGHSILSLLEALKKLGIEAKDELFSFARNLDKHYIPTRYPNAHPSKSPFQYYDQADASQAIDNANFIIQFAKEAWAELKKEEAKEAAKEEETGQND